MTKPTPEDLKRLNATLDTSENRLGETMLALRQRKKKARIARDRPKELEAHSLYRKCAGQMARLVRRRLKIFDSSAEVTGLIADFKSVNADLKAELAKVKDLKKKIDKAKKVISRFEKLLKKALKLVA